MRVIPSIERTPVTFGEIVRYGVYPLVVSAPTATVDPMALPAYSHDPEPVPPEAEPEAIRACLSQQMRYEFDQEWEFVLEEAKHSHSLAGVAGLLVKWRHIAYAELKDPGTYYRLMAKAEQILATGKAPAGSISGDELKVLLQERLAG